MFLDWFHRGRRFHYRRFTAFRATQRIDNVRLFIRIDKDHIGGIRITILFYRNRVRPRSKLAAKWCHPGFLTANIHDSTRRGRFNVHHSQARRLLRLFLIFFSESSIQAGKSQGKIVVKVSRSIRVLGVQGCPFYLLVYIIKCLSKGDNTVFIPGNVRASPHPFQQIVGKCPVSSAPLA